MKTAIEWLVEQLKEQKFVTESQIHIAKEMEKQQIEIAFNEGQQEEAKTEFWTKGEYYYNKTFKIK
jgi:uncharacterized membrane protein